MLLRILWLACLVCTTFSGPVIKIEEYSNDLTKVENTEDAPYTIFEDDSTDYEPKIYDDLENLEEIQRPKASILSKRMASGSDQIKSPDVRHFSENKREFISYISKNLPLELIDANLSDIQEVQKIVSTVCNLYDRYVENRTVKSNPEESNENMMGDQPMNDDSGFKKISVPTFDDVPTVRNRLVSSSERPPSEISTDDMLARENKEKRMSLNGDSLEDRTRDMYLSTFKHRLLSTISRPNTSVPIFPNLTIPFPVQTSINMDSPYAEKIRSFYPTCEIPKITKDAWKEENFLNLFFNVDYNQNATIATATLRLHRLPRENQTSSFWNSEICPDHTIFEEEKLLRVSIYWYVKSSKKHSKVKRRLCDSKMISENSPWVELSVKTATRTWTKSGKNMGLGVLVEDQDGGTLKATKYFKGATCTVGTIGTPTPRPIPTLITDQINDSAGIFALFGLNQTGSLPSDFGLLPKIDVCVLELPGQMPLVQLTRGDCELKNSLSELINSNGFKGHHHIRHQKHLENVQQREQNSEANGKGDFRSRIINKTLVIPKSVVERLNSAQQQQQNSEGDVRSRIINKALVVPKGIHETLNNGSINR